MAYSYCYANIAIYQGSNGEKHFIFVTNLSPCSGVRLHLWREKGTPNSKVSFVEVTSKMVHIPSGPAPRQVEDVYNLTEHQSISRISLDF